MSEVHHPLSHPKSFGALIVELLMISIAVFLGLFADQWRENRHLEELAKSALVNFRSEILTNKAAIEKEKDYHARLLKDSRVFVAQPPPHDMPAFIKTLHFNGMHPIDFEHTAWDLALSTQSLAHIKPELAYQISAVYTHQASYQNYENMFMGAMLAPGTFGVPDLRPAVISLEQFLGDVVAQEPKFLKEYDDLLPAINVVLGEIETRP